MKRLLPLGCLAAYSLFVSVLYAEDEKKITFDEHIKPIFREHCLSCHNQQDKQSDLALDTYGGALTGGSSGEVVKEGDASASRLLALVNHAEQPYMPPDQDPIAEPKRLLIKTWIEQGMPENSGSAIKRTNKAAAAMLSSVSAGKPDGPPAMPQTVLRQPVTVTERSAAIAAMAASPWAPLFAIGGQKQVSLYAANSGELLGIIPFPEGEPQCLTFTRDGKHLLIGGGRHSHSGYAVLVDVVTGERVAKVGDELDIVLAADITFDKKRIALGGPQKMVRIYDTFSGQLIKEMKKHTDWIYSVRFSPDGVLLASGDRSNGLVVWEAQSGLLYADLVGHKGEVRGLDFRADSNVLASASKDGTIKLWDMFESKEIKSWAAHGGGASAVAFTQTGLLASAGMDARVKLWNGDGALQKEFVGLGESALEVAITGDGTQVAGGDWTGKVQMWNIADPNQTRVLAANPPSIQQRLTAAQAQLASVTSESASIKQATDSVLAEATAAANQLAVAGQQATETTAKLTEATKNQQSAMAQVAQVDQQIAALEAQLAAAKSQKVQFVAQLEQANAAVQQLSQSAKAAQESMVAAQAKHAEMTKAAEVAKLKQSEADAKLAAARAAADQALADQAALDAYALKLQQETQALSLQTQQLAEQLVATEKDSQVQAEAVAKVNGDLKSLQEQLAALQKQLESTANAQATAAQQLADRQKKAQELKAAQEAAAQSAADAKERLELFQQSYAPPAK